MMHSEFEKNLEKKLGHTGGIRNSPIISDLIHPLN